MTAPNISLRDYLAAHAPMEPQFWFQPVMRPRPEVPLPSDVLSPEDYRDWKNELLEFDREHCSATLVAFERQYGAAVDAVEEWERECKKQRFIQWPYAWADAQLARHNDAQRDELQEQLRELAAALRPFAEQPTTEETPGVARDEETDEDIYRARAALARCQP